MKDKIKNNKLKKLQKIKNLIRKEIVKIIKEIQKRNKMMEKINGNIMTCKKDKLKMKIMKINIRMNTKNFIGNKILRIQQMFRSIYNNWMI